MFISMQEQLSHKKQFLNNQQIIKELFCDRGGIQTHDLQNRNLTLYSAKLPNQRQCKSIYNIGGKQTGDEKNSIFDILQTINTKSLPFCK